MLELTCEAEVLKTTKRLRMLLVAEALLAGINGLYLTLALLSGPIVAYNGFVSSGYVSLSKSQLNVGGSGAILRPLESVETLSLMLLVVSVAVIVLSLLTATRAVFASREDFVAKTLALALPVAGVHITSTLLLATLLSLLRVTLRDIISYIPTSYSVETTAGRLYLNATKTLYSWIYNFYMRNQPVLWIYLSAQAAFFAVVVAYSVLAVSKSSKYATTNRENTEGRGATT
ncbi:hypothetical protein DKAM_0081 [Desulfurococcus amylolyticus 1221n]|uniref:Uncharacterized protein n=1 Tax=Desulfurococcus amylolyticus (strain DSM 18924 / JCM 16383 / VKM B-2413 / 1221n) TaxID=490899 RepID=B8D3E1_DESA1|nr:hypothetical protein DKAM_0081 [Desulfurococcus amylolyticus 1221n]